MDAPPQTKTGTCETAATFVLFIWGAETRVPTITKGRKEKKSLNFTSRFYLDRRDLEVALRSALDKMCFTLKHQFLS